MADSPARDAATLNGLQLLHDLHAALNCADAMGLAQVGFRIEQAIDALAQPQPQLHPASGVPSPSATES